MEKLPNVSRLVKLMQSGKVYPSGPLCFVVLLFSGLACAGGFNQTTWLTEVKKNFLKLLKEANLTKETDVKRIASIATKNFSESFLAFLNIGGEYINPSALDLYLKSKDYYPAYLKLAEAITLKQSLNLAMPTIYSVVVPKIEQVKNFNLNLSNRRLLNSGELKKTLKAAGL